MQPERTGSRKSAWFMKHSTKATKANKRFTCVLFTAGRGNFGHLDHRHIETGQRAHKRCEETTTVHGGRLTNGVSQTGSVHFSPLQQLSELWQNPAHCSLNRETKKKFLFTVIDTYSAKLIYSGQKLFFTCKTQHRTRRKDWCQLAIIISHCCRQK